jgi:hypothetical protein
VTQIRLLLNLLRGSLVWKSFRNARDSCYPGCRLTGHLVKSGLVFKIEQYLRNGTTKITLIVVQLKELESCIRKEGLLHAP